MVAANIRASHIRIRILFIPFVSTIHTHHFHFQNDEIYALTTELKDVKAKLADLIALQEERYVPFDNKNVYGAYLGLNFEYKDVRCLAARITGRSVGARVMSENED